MCQLIDVGTPAEYRECHATSAQNIPFDSLDPKTIVESKKGSKETPLYIICQSGNRAKKACEMNDFYLENKVREGSIYSFKGNSVDGLAQLNVDGLPIYHYIDCRENSCHYLPSSGPFLIPV